MWKMMRGNSACDDIKAFSGKWQIFSITLDELYVLPSVSIDEIFSHCQHFIDNVAPEDDELDEFYNEIEKKRDYSHFRAWKKSEWLRMLELAGFEIDEWHRFEKTFQFDSWCNLMKVPATEKKELNSMIAGSPKNVKEKFRIILHDQIVQSFQGESIILKAQKR
jgi:hypothetical protein